MNLADNLKKIRKEHNLSQEQLAEKLGVSRQSVSKWESNQAYPEMDKVLQLCQIFNLNIDDLLNQDIKEVSNNKQSKNNINKFIDDFLDYITKTIDIFSIMKFKNKIKCLFEQLIIIGIITILFAIIGTVLANILRNLISIFPDKVYYVIYNLFESIYIVISLILGIVLLLHIFKVRYLDYYDIIKQSPNEIDKEGNIEETNQDNKEIDNQSLSKKKDKKIKTKILLEKKSEKIIIRDPKHSGYKFISSLLKCLLFIIKFIVAFITLFFCISLITLAFCFVIPFVFIKTGLFFIGTIISIISLIIINIIILIILYHFLISKKNKKSKLAISFLISLILLGLGIGIISISITKFNYIDNIEDINYIKDEITIPMEDDLFFQDYYGKIEYVEADIKDIKITYNHSKYYDIIMNDEGKIKYFYSQLNTSGIDLTKAYIKDINNKNIINYSDYQIIIYASASNLKRMENNEKIYYEKQYQETEERNNLENRIYELEEQIEEKDYQIEILQEQLEHYESTYDE